MPDGSNKWPDDRLDDLASQVRTVAALSTIVSAHDVKIDLAADEREGIRDWLKDVEARLMREIGRVQKECEDFHIEYLEDQKAAKAANRTMVGVIGAAVIALMGSIITTAAQLLGG